MVSSEEKRKCIENVIELSSNEETKSIALKNLYQVLLKDTLNGNMNNCRCDFFASFSVLHNSITVQC